VEPPKSRLCWILDDGRRTFRAVVLLLTLYLVAAVLAPHGIDVGALMSWKSPAPWSAAAVGGVAASRGAYIVGKRWWASRKKPVREPASGGGE
jgi:hypothetical protein